MSVSKAKYLVNDPDHLVTEFLQGLCAAHPFLSLDTPHKVVYRADIDTVKQHQVTVISGGGSGHEPTHAGFVGSGMLSAAVAGQVFASPSSSQILCALHRCASPRYGTLVIVKNYTGDVINFGRAVERARYENFAKDFKMVVVADDVGVNSTDSSDVGRRGLAGTILVHKVAGAAAALGESLDMVYQAAQMVAQNIATMGVSLSTCTVPGTTPGKERQLGSDEVEFGLGIHGEPGFETTPLQSLKTTVNRMLDRILEFPEMHSTLKATSTTPRVVLLVNNLGSTTTLEMYAALREAVLYLRKQSIMVIKVCVGTFMTALTMHGLSLTLFRVPPGSEDMILKYLNHPTHVVGWNPLGDDTLDWDTLTSTTAPPVSQEPQGGFEPSPKSSTTAMVPDSYLTQVWQPAIMRACENVISAEPTITAYDTVWGDADCGLTLKQGATAIQKGFSSATSYTIPMDPQRPDHTIAAISELVEDSMGGTSGGLYGILLDSLAAHIQTAHQDHSIDTERGLSLGDWAHCLRAALSTLQQYTTARRGHRTLMDVLIPFVEALESAVADGTTTNLEGLQRAVEAARLGVEATKTMVPRRGRATYIGGQAGGDLDKYSIPDPGAYGLYKLFEGLSQAFD
ncbi:hypothetical protein IWQ62_002561 [Dispira parvispora]|uniref:Dihydroxyacetone kinase n=1 Tax=Dispira parvispora TaxID=1520584 RepID=A0A9W8E723_9FUNG|nr:hypothetical protein IWQ62_002561 [Dispira parvispora]